MGVAQLAGLTQLLGIDFQSAVVAGLQLPDPRLVDIQAQGGKAAAKFNRQRQADITQANNADAGGGKVKHRGALRHGWGRQCRLVFGV